MKARIFGLALLLITACQPREVSELKQDDPKDLQGEIPSEGRSLFDQITMVRQGDAVVQKLAFPFEALRAQLESKMQSPLTVTLLPKGRSLQRNATTEPFRFPRVVLAAIADGKSGPDDLGFQIRDRLYVGYVESANQLEAISYNPDLGRFEFQIIDNYGPGLEPRVRYANRAFCLSCHQNESPIFSNPGWDETPANPKIQERLIAAIKSDKYLGIPIKQFPNIPNAIDDATDRANLLIPYQKLWNKGCDDAHCRRLSMELALGYRLFDTFDDALYASVKTAYEKGWRRSFPNGLNIPQNNIPNFNPLLNEGKDIPADAEPLKERKDPLEVWTLDNEDSARLIFGIAGEFQDADAAWLRARIPDAAALSAVLDRLEQAADSIFKARAFTRCRTLAAIATTLGSALPGCDFRAFAAMPPAHSTGADANHGEQKDPRLALFRSYCSQCHGSGSLNFLEGDDQTVIENLKRSGTRHIERLTWETTAARTMPPANSNPRKVLETRPEDRAEMIRILKDLTGTP